MALEKISVFARLALIITILAFFPALAHAQDNSSVTGVVTDQSGAVVADASVTLSNPSIGFTSTKVTNGVGGYEFSNVPPDKNYSLEFSKSGFTTLNLDKIILNVGSKETRDAVLRVGDTKISVEVTASAAESLNPTDATISSGIDVPLCMCQLAHVCLRSWKRKSSMPARSRALGQAVLLF